MRAMVRELDSGIFAVVADHLWQSTLFALAAALVVSALLRRNRANERYWVWLAASLKFLMPFSLLVSAGRSLGYALDSSHQQSWWQNAAIRAGAPFSWQSAEKAMQPIHAVTWVLLSLWVCGVVVVLAIWFMRWRTIARALREGVAICDGPEARMLHLMQRRLGVRRPISLLRCPSSLEPGVFGIVRPVLLWPAGISMHFTPSHLQAVIAHEVCHVRRCDNLTAALHMLVEAIFWFHPLVWWLGARLMRERERACDQSVLELGSEPAVYAESILKTCQFCVGSPLPVLSGVTGAELRQRIVDIMTGEASRRLGPSTKLLLSSAAAFALLIPAMFGMSCAYVCHGDAYEAVALPAVCDLSSEQRDCRVMADEFLKVPRLSGAMAPVEQDGGI
jgi:bla regulator protein BlaR1